MKREPFYVIPKPAWIFPQKEGDAITRNQPEEMVRQWCAFELVRAYGYRVTDLEFERPVKVGSKNYRTDILVVHDGRPLAIVECKERNFKKHAQAMEQAISYASARDIQCELACYTNGDTWLVRRKIGNLWTPIADLPHRQGPSAQGSLDELLMTLQSVEPVLHKLDAHIAGKDARLFLSALQEFFIGRNLLTDGFNDDLRIATDHVLRVLHAGTDDEDYATKKLRAAIHSFEEYRKLSGSGHPLSDSIAGVPMHTCYAELKGGLAAMDRSEVLGHSPDILLLRLNIALLNYGRHQTLARGEPPTVPPEVHHTLRHVLEFGFSSALGIKLPTALESTTTSDMKDFCRAAWDQFVANHPDQ
jgi:hypothetical protein